MFSLYLINLYYFNVHQLGCGGKKNREYRELRINGQSWPQLGQLWTADLSITMLRYSGRENVKDEKTIILVVSLLLLCPNTRVTALEEPVFPAPEDYVQPDHYYTDEEVMMNSSQSMLNPGDGLNEIIPVDPGQGAADCSVLTNEQIGFVFNIANGNSVVIKEMHNGTYCYKFVSGNDVLYIPASYLYKTSSGTCSRSTFNTTMTNRVNSSNTSSVIVYVFCSYKFYDEYNNTVYRFNIAKIEGEAHINTGITMYTTLTIVDTVAFDVYDNFVNCVYTYSSNLKVKPTITKKTSH